MSKHVTVIGAGFSGLVAAWSLSRKGHHVTVIERGPAPGGLIGTFDVDGFKVETAANGLLSSRLVEELFEDCGVPLITAQRTAKKRYLYVDGKITRWPLRLTESVRMGFGLLAIFLFKLFRAKPEESLLAWGSRAFGQSFAKKVLATGVWGIFASPAETLSAKLITQRLFSDVNSEHLKRVRQRGRHRGTVSAEGGMGQLISGLHKCLEARGVVFKFKEDGDRALRNALEATHSNRGDWIVVATSAKQAASLLGLFPIFSKTVSHLATISMLSLISIGVHFSKPAKRLGFGTLFSQDEKVGGSNDGILGALQNSVIFSNRCASGTSSETWILGGQDHGDRYLNLSDDELLQLVLKKRREILGEEEPPVLNFRVTRWPLAIPHFGKNLELTQFELNKPVGPVVLFGNYLGEIGLRSILEQAENLHLKIRI
ncbi:MAG: protoporphyrinogen oxidase [Deltaproteobacteria bacterium]|jgi:oxygen-dependent protoporphyrinogen oxidase|nr:protoporphyrinogen oxidase [Deltaproteobacteria bacterium]